MYVLNKKYVYLYSVYTRNEPIPNQERTVNVH